jgi:hypothetical protein
MAVRPGLDGPRIAAPPGMTRAAGMRAALVLALLAGCSHVAPTVSPSPSTVEPATAPSATSDPAPPPAPSAGAEAPGPTPRRDAPRLSVNQITDVLFLPGDARPDCSAGDDVVRIGCAIAARFASDPEAAKLASNLFERTGDVAGVLAPEVMEGGFRGKLHLVPALPIGKYRTHLAWVAEATRDFDAFFDALSRGDAGAPRYVWRGLSFRFMRSVAARTPSAYALDWSIAYNVDGSLNKSADAVRELLFHENFHLNDQDHGDWSVRALRMLYDGILARCGTRMACLAPYTPTDMTVIGGTYYAFQPDNGDGVHEYAAELALRYYREQRAVLRGLPHPGRFKCGKEENAKAWALIVGEFFGGIDRTPPCEG